jgi:hypothetical protein
VAARGATSAEAGIALRAARRINQKAARASATFHRQPRHVGFGTFFLSVVDVTNTPAVRFPGREQTVGEWFPLKRRSVYGLRADRQLIGKYRKLGW